VPIAAWRGKGKRTGAYGAYLLACYDPDEEVRAPRGKTWQCCGQRPVPRNSHLSFPPRSPPLSPRRTPACPPLARAQVWQAITKVGTGFSDEMLAELTAAFDASGAARPPHAKPKEVQVGDLAKDVDVWFEPTASEVWEVAAADLSISPVHMAAVGKVAEDKGIALRFPRFLRRRPREDKGPEQATTSDQVADMYRNQGVIKGAAGGGDDDE
jgi:DNA ligase 1